MTSKAKRRKRAAGRKRPVRRHDRTRRLLFTHRRMIKDLLRGFVAEPWIADLDFDTLTKLSTDYVVDGLDERIGDVVWEVKGHDGPVYVFILIELQSRAEPFMALRMLAYVALFYQRLLKERPLGKGEKLPPVLPILFYNGDQAYDAEVEVFDLITAVPPGLEAYQPSMRHLLIDELRWPCSAFVGLRNAVAAFLRLQQSSPQEMRDLVLEERVLDWIEERDEPLLRDLLEWMSLVLLPQRQRDVAVPKLKSLDELKGYMEKDMESWNDMLRAEGEAQGLAKGRVEGEAMVLLSLIEEKFGAVDDTVTTKVRSADAGRLLEWAKRILTARRLDEVFNGGAG